MILSIVSYLNPESTLAVRSIQQDLGVVTGAKASLELWRPHVTVGDGVEVSDDELLKLRVNLENVCAKLTPFQIDLRDIIKLDTRKGGDGETTTPYGLYLNVKLNDALLNLVASVSSVSEDFTKWYFMPTPYHPHCALAFKDLSKEGFERGIDFLDKQDIRLTATLDHVALVEMLPDATRELVRFNLGQ